MAKKSSIPEKGNVERLTVESLRYYVPIFQEADDTYEDMLPKLIDQAELEVQAKAALALREMVVDRLMKLSEPLIYRELNNNIAKSHLRGTEENIFNQLFYAGRAGAIKGLRHFDVNKLDSSATNYLLQWFIAYAKKELLAIEAAPFGIPPSRFHTYKKVSAVRKKLTEELGRYANNQEVLDYFHSGAADVKSMAGRRGASNKRYTSNQKMTIELVQEQEYFERNLISQNLIDPLDKQMSELVFGETSVTIFSETLFGSFIEAYEFTPQAIVALKHELQVDLSLEEHELLDNLTNSALRKLISQWKLLIRDPKGLFYEFIVRNKDTGFEEFDIQRTIQSIDESEELINRAQWADLLMAEEKIK